MPDALRPILFDCDGVLVDSEGLALECELACLAEIGLSFDADDFKQRFLGTSSADFFAGLDDEHRRAFGAPLPESFEPTLRARYRETFDARLERIAGVEEVLHGLHGRPKAVASSSSVAGLHRKLEQTGLADFFDGHVYSAEMVPRAKPAPDLFLHAASELGAAAAECIVIEDSVNGVLAAVAAGMQVIGFTGGSHCGPEHGDRLLANGAIAIVAHMSALPAHIEGLAGGERCTDLR